ncbi:MAG TPA: 2-oxo acid dehydrogenase subunit E2 [Clostridiaceae bacterium]|nr:2-oxo acid dehydrogenase subunit E2 [Clostridiaceae bacterium]
MAGRKRRFGDRYDGRLLRTIDPFYKIIPYIMSNRVDAQNFYNDKIDIERIEAFLRKKRNSNIKNLSFLHIVLAAIVRTISQRPGLNRFIAGQKIYARNEILISLAIKKELREDSPETTVKIKFEPTDTLYEVVAKVNEAIENNKKDEVKNDTDKTAKIIMLCPGFLVKFIVWIVSKLDYIGLMPKIFNRVSPFHTSVFVTDLGSLGIPPVYHHLYNFGTTSIFVAFGAKQKEKVINRDNNIVERKYVPVKIVTDERIVDGHYFASAFKLFKKYLKNPESLEVPPEQVFEDIE